MKPRNASGFTLIEMMIVIAILGIVLAIAVPAINEWIASQKVKSVASTLRSSLVLTRSEALKRNANITLAPTVSDGPWTDGWSVQLGDGTVLSAYSPVTSLSISGGPTSVVFQGTGRISTGAGATFKISSSNTSAIRCVVVSLTGIATVTTSGC